MLMRKQSVGKYCLWGNGLGALRVLLVLLLLCSTLWGPAFVTPFLAHL